MQYVYSKASAEAAFFDAVSGELREDDARRLAQALAGAVEERCSLGEIGKNHSPLRLLSARRRWAVKDDDLFLAKSLAAIIAQIPGIIEGDPDSLFAAVAAVFLLARHARSKGCRLTKDETSALVCLKSAGRGISALRLARLLGWPEEKAEEVLAGLKEARLEDGSTASFVIKDRRGFWRSLGV